MIVLTLRTDNPEAEVGVYDHGKRFAYTQWQAHRQLAETIHEKIDEVLRQASKSMDEVGGVVVYKGPGSFTGLRIGLSVANALAYSLSLPIAASSGGDWIEQGIKKLETGQNDKIALPTYSSPAHTTEPRK